MKFKKNISFCAKYFSALKLSYGSVGHLNFLFAAPLYLISLKGRIRSIGLSPPPHSEITGYIPSILAIRSNHNFIYTQLSMN